MQPPPEAVAPAAPAPPALPATPQAAGGMSPQAAAAIYQGLRAQRRELAQQLESLEDRRDDFTEQLQNPAVVGADRTGLEARIAEIDQRILAMDQQIALNNAEVARAAALPGATTQPPPPPRSGPPEEVLVLSILFMLIVLLPLTIAYARRIWRRGAAVVSTLPAELYDRLTRLEQSSESIALEVERIGEGQRFMTRLFSERGDLRALAVRGAEVQPPEAPPLHR